MCTYDVYTDVFPDGRTTKHHRPTLCKHSRNNLPCSNTHTYEHPPRPVTSVSGPYVFPAAPITPRDTPRPGSSSRESGNESDRSRNSASKRTKRTVYIDGKRVVDVSEANKPARNKANTSERIVIVDAPPTARTPPQIFTFPHTAPPSPSAGYSPQQQQAQPQQLYPGGINIMAPSPRLSPTSAAFPHAHSYTQGFTTPYGPSVSAHRPIIVDERHRPTVIETHHASSRTKDRESKEARRERREKRHSREGSSTSNSSVESERRRRREAEAMLRETQAQLESQMRKQRIAERIRLANAEIASRRPVPIAREQTTRSNNTTTAGAAMPKAPAPPSPLKRSSTSFFASTPAANTSAPVSHRSSNSETLDRDLAETMRRLDLANKAKKERERADENARERRRLEDLAREREIDGLRARDAEEARLRERMMPRRRFTVGPGNRRQRVMYEDGVYRWE